MAKRAYRTIIANYKWRKTWRAAFQAPAPTPIHTTHTTHTSNTTPEETAR